MDSELMAKLNERKRAVDSIGTCYQNTPTEGRSDRCAADTVSFKNSRTDTWESIASLQKKAFTRQESILVVGTDELSATWHPLLRIPLPHCLTSSKFRLCEVDDWQIKFYPRGTKGEGDKSTMVLHGPTGDDVRCSKVALICGNQMQVPVDWTGEVSFDFLTRHLESAELELCVRVTMKKSC
eukprot:GEMP01023385.1.p1 GENE.GEMP01023385.1~~GEMP01023385.1.p1  ORF type:complete len:182 (+),score=32.43 GEMP01023385.1:96-641(+)